VRLRSYVCAGLVAATALGAALFGCGAFDSATPTPGAAADGATDEASVAPDANAGADGALDSGVDAAPRCTNAAPFVDDFELRSDLTGCWDGLTKSGLLASTSSGELGTSTGTSGHGFVVKLVPADGGPGGGAVYLSKKLAQPLPAPARLDFKWLAAVFPTSAGDGSSGLFAVELVYQYMDTTGLLQVGRRSVAFGVNAKTINPYLSGGGFVPLAALDPGGLYESALELTTAQLKLVTNSPNAVDRVLTLPFGSDFAVTEIRIGVTDVGSISAPWTLYFDDVRLAPK